MTDDDVRDRVAAALYEHGIALAGRIIDDVVSAVRGEVPIAVESAVESEADAPAHKRKALETLIAQGAVLVHLDPRCDGVDVPAAHAAGPTLALRLGWNLSPPISHMNWDDDGISVELSFGGVTHLCALPWGAIYLIMIEGTTQGVLWSDDVPPDARPNTEPPPPASPERPRLSLVP